MTREKAIKILSSYKNSYFGDALHGGVISVSEIIELLSAQSENDWIPVTKKAHPDKEGEYLVTDDAGGMVDSTWDEFIFCDDGTPSWMYSQNVTAWKPFPEPYTERREK